MGNGRLAAGLTAANGNKSVGLLSGTNWTRIIEMLDAFEAMGVGLVKVDIQYPVFTPAFHTYLAANPPPLVPVYNFTVDNFIGHPNSFYNKLVDEIRGRGMGLWIEHSTLFGEWSSTPPAGYFADMRSLGVPAARARYLQERAAEMVLIEMELHPDYYSLVDEPTTQNDNFGYFPGNIPILTQDGWRDLVQSAAQDILAADPASPTLLGAGSGTWETRAYTERFAVLPELDFIDFHQYPFGTNGEDFAQNLLDWADYVHGVAPAKKLTLGETWLYKASAAEVTGGLDHDIIFGRDTYSFWEPLDSEFIELAFKIMHYKGFDAAMPFWSLYYFAYLTYGDPDLDGLSGVELVAVAGQESIPNVQTVTLTGTGQKFVELLSATADADGDGTPDSQDTSDSDGDMIADNAEHFCGSAAISATSRPERIDGPFAAVDDDGDLAMSEALPAGAEGYDCDGDGFTGSAEAGDPLCGNGVNEDGVPPMSDDGVPDDGCPGGPAQAGAWSEGQFNLGLGDQDACGGNGWPLEFVTGGIPDSTNRVTLLDLTSFVAIPRHFNTSPGHAAFDKRWDLLPGKGTSTEWINLQDFTAVIASGSSTGKPPMMGGVRAFGGPVCPWPP